MATKPQKNFPDPESIRGMARGLGVTVTDVIMAVARSLDLPVYTGNDPSALSIGGAGDLDASTKDALATVVREFIRLTSQREDGSEHGKRTEEEQESRTQAGSTVDSSEARGDRLRPGAPMNGDNVTAFPNRDQDDDLDDELAAHTGETAELRRRRLEGEPGEQPDEPGPDHGA